MAFVPKATPGKFATTTPTVDAGSDQIVTAAVPSLAPARLLSASITSESIPLVVFPSTTHRHNFLPALVASR